LSSSADQPHAAYDGVAPTELARRLGVPQVHVYARVGSTMDVAHALAAAGAPAGTLVLADAQSGGRGRAGRRWLSPPGAGIWLTLLERPGESGALDVLPLRLGLHAALAVQPFADGAVQVKWPNDLQIARRKLAGVLVEARWRDAQPEWVAIGLGLNVLAPAGVDDATGLGADASRLPVLAALVPALRAAAAARGLLDADELRMYAERDAIAGRRVCEPLPGIVRRVLASGELLLAGDDGHQHRLRQATLRFAD
jgi:BirA family biotin operon repressor/biotin-[acetyl-CoA-carboxylase] ligase